ncbi:MAG: menaquinone biosynthesis protein [Deltaproteobacteria bacterium]|nr:menaquinone biosynthesis protein [Deltaproteobacteria bacterium]
MRLGYINYLNCYPFFYHMFEYEQLDNIEVIQRYPNELNLMIREGSLDMSAISSATYPLIQDKALLLPDFCLSSIGYVGSVILSSNLPVEELGGKRVGLTKASHTSVLLLKMLLKNYYNVVPEYVLTKPNPSMDGLDAALMIGNEAMVRSSAPVPFSYDLGELWLRKTGYPVVFAVFAINEKAIDKFSSQITRVVNSFRRSIECLDKEPEKMVEAAHMKYPDIAYDVKGYYETCLQFKFSSRLKQALQFYYTKAFDMGLLEKKVKIRYLE